MKPTTRTTTEATDTDDLEPSPSSPPADRQVRIFRLETTTCSGKLLVFDFDGGETRETNETGESLKSRTTCNDEDHRRRRRGGGGGDDGNRGNDNNNAMATMMMTMMGELVDATYSEGAVLERDGPALERFYRSECIYSRSGEQRFKQAVAFEAGLNLKPVRFSSTVVVYTYSTRKRFKDVVDLAPNLLKTRSYSETVFARPRSAREVFRTTVVHHDDRRYVGRYVTGLELGLFAKFVDVSSVMSKQQAAKKVINGAA